MVRRYPGVHHVPEAVWTPTRPGYGAVSDQVLLIAVEVDVPGDVTVGDEATTGVVTGGAVILEDDIAVDDVPPDRRPLGDCPELGGIGTARAVSISTGGT